MIDSKDHNKIRLMYKNIYTLIEIYTLVEIYLLSYKNLC